MSIPTLPKPSRGRREDEFTGQRHVYVPHSVGLPPLGSYLRELWRRREFAVELSRTQLREQHFDTAFGQLWLVLNPLLLSFVYFLLVDILRAHGSHDPKFFAHLMGGLFAFYFIHNSISVGVKSVTKGGRLILNSAFPRALLPLSAVITAFMRFLPTIVVYTPVHILSGLPIGPHLLWALPIVALLVLLACGLAMLVAAAQVYFRDLSSFLPYILRIWLYISPVLYYAESVPHRYKFILDINPLGGLLTAWSDVLNRGHAPDAGAMLLGLAWGIGLFVVAGLFFMSREREFAVRL
ncbi:MAG: teichoic acid transport system permease protein [Solirubrobacteraceae bacterium]|jgi:teichoic acid transport system permease protein|nr:teichoic acid transport system permease protein [Solirubrobacteraceae bacterium]